MFRSLTKEINIRRFYFTVVSIFIFDIIYSWFLRFIYFEPFIRESGSMIFRPLDQVMLFWFWNIFGWILYSFYGTFTFISWTTQKNPFEGLRTGLLSAFFPSSFLFILSPYIAFPTFILWGMVAHIFIVYGINGALAVKIYNWEYLNSKKFFN